MQRGRESTAAIGIRRLGQGRYKRAQCVEKPPAVRNLRRDILRVEGDECDIVSLLAILKEVIVELSLLYVQQSGPNELAVKRGTYS